MARTTPHVEIVHTRDPDAACTLTVFVNGHPVEADIFTVDPGAGYTPSEWDDQIADLPAHFPEASEQFTAHATYQHHTYTP